MLHVMRLNWFLGLFLLAFQVCAEDRFQIELVIFSQNMPSTELFDQTQSLIKWPDMMQPGGSPDSVAAGQQVLKPVYDKLAGEPAYQVLLYTAWVQTVTADASGEAVRIQGNNGEINGFARIRRGDYLQLTLDLEYQPLPDQFYRLNEVRRIKFNEQHYFDHPKFGVIALVKPL